MVALYSTAQIRAIEAAALAQLPPGTLMRRAGAQAARYALRLLNSPKNRQHVLVIAGPGNNGGDACRTAIALAHAGCRVTVLACAVPRTNDAAQALEDVRRAAIPVVADLDWSIAAQRYTLVVDGLFGIGLSRPLSGMPREIVDHVNRTGLPVLALDVPSGLDADTGFPAGSNGIAIRAAHTITFLGAKPGLYTGAGRDFAGEVEIAALGVDPDVYSRAAAWLNSPALFSDCLMPRAHGTNKGSYGDANIIGGADGMAGALLLAARAALHCGAGRVFAASIGTPLAFDPIHPELMCRSAEAIQAGSAVCVIGPGLGKSDTASQCLSRMLDGDGALLIDADALNLIAADPALQQQLTSRAAAKILTPHPLEAARLLATDTAAVQRDRIAAAHMIARRFRAIVVLKGSGTVIAAPDGRCVINPTGNPALATAGTGDVLAGTCGALLAQRWPAWQAALAGVWMHGAAADALAAGACGPIGMTASELIPAIRRCFNQLVLARPQP